ncbi:hypothetical protein BH11ACT6_BH11ACT6_09360 [soil metagenome]
MLDIPADAFTQTHRRFETEEILGAGQDERALDVVVIGVCPVAELDSCLGSQTAGSLTRPAAYCKLEPS